MTHGAILRSLAAVVACAILVCAAAGELLSRPTKRTLGAAPLALGADNVLLDQPGVGAVAGWFVQGAPGRGAILLLHGLRADRRQMLARAQLFKGLGYSVLLIDLPAHGESGGDRITFGWREARGVDASLAYLRNVAPGERIGVIGVSLGAASLVLAGSAPPPAAVVLESMAPTIAQALENRLRMRLGRAGAGLAPLLLWQLPLRAGVSADQLRPINVLARLGAPVLVASGTADRHTTMAETLEIFQAAAEPKELWLVDGAAHGDLQAHDPDAYAAKVVPFMERYLRAGG